MGLQVKPCRHPAKTILQAPAVVQLVEVRGLVINVHTQLLGKKKTPQDKLVPCLQTSFYRRDINGIFLQFQAQLFIPIPFHPKCNIADAAYLFSCQYGNAHKRETTALTPLIQVPSGNTKEGSVPPQRAPGPKTGLGTLARIIGCGFWLVAKCEACGRPVDALVGLAQSPVGFVLVVYRPIEPPLFAHMEP